MASSRFTFAVVFASAVGLIRGALTTTAAGCPGWDGSCSSSMGQNMLQASRSSMLETLHGEATSETAQKVLQGLHVDLSELEEYVDALGTNAVGHNYTMSDKEKSAIVTITQLVRQMQHAIDTQHSEDQAEIYRMSYLIGNCSSDANTSLNQVAALISSVQASRRSHTSCRSSEGIANDSMTTACSDYDSHRKSNAPPTCFPNELKIDYLQAGDGTKKSQMEACLEALHSWLSPLYTKYDGCKSGMELHKNRSAECDSEQQTFEQAFCLYESKLEDACDVQETCIARTTAARDSAQANVKLSEAARKADFAASKRLLCLLEVLMSNNTQKVQTLAQCKNQTAQTSKYDVVYPDTPKATSCVKEQSEPCDSSWVARQYETQTWYDKARTKACRPCQSPTTTTSTIQTTSTWTKIGAGSCRDENGKYMDWGNSNETNYSETDSSARDKCAKQASCVAYSAPAPGAPRGYTQFVCSSIGGLCDRPGTGATRVVTSTGPIHGFYCNAKLWTTIGAGTCRDENGKHMNWGFSNETNRSETDSSARDKCAKQASCVAYNAPAPGAPRGITSFACSSIGGLCDKPGNGATRVVTTTDEFGTGFYCSAKV